MRSPRLALTALVVAGLAVLTPANDARAQLPPGMPMVETTKVAEGVYSYRFMFHRSMFVVTRDGVIATDPINARAATALLAEIKKVTDKPLKYVVYSHEHWDHIAGGKVLKDAGARFIAQENCVAAFKRVPNTDVVMPDGTYKNRFDIKLGGTTLELHHFGRSHGNCMTVMYLPKEKIVFVVDLATPKRVQFRGMFDSYPTEWIETLKKIEGIGATQMIPGHGAPIVPIGEVKLVREYMQDLMAAVKDAMTKTQNRDEIIKMVKLPKYESWGSYNEWLGMNVERIITLYANGA